MITNYLIYTFQIIKHPPNPPSLAHLRFHKGEFIILHFNISVILSEVEGHSHILTFTNSHMVYLPLHSAQHIDISAGNIAVNTYQ